MTDIKLKALIRSCKDSMYWYAGREGEMFDLYAEYTGGALTQGDGWRVWTGTQVNFVALQDAEIVPTCNGDRLHAEPPPAPEHEDPYGVCETPQESEQAAPKYLHHCWSCERDDWFDFREFVMCETCNRQSRGKRSSQGKEPHWPCRNAVSELAERALAQAKDPKGYRHKCQCGIRFFDVREDAMCICGQKTHGEWRHG